MTEQQEINLLDYFRVIYKRRWLVAAITASASIIAVIISLMLPKIYSSTASILPQQDSPMGGPFMGGSADGGGKGIAMGMLGSYLGMGSPADLWLGIMKSQTVKDAVIQRFGLREVYGAETMENTRAALGNRVTLETTDEGIITVTVEDKDPRRAAGMANAFVAELDRVNRKTITTSGGRMRAFVKQRLAETQKALANAEDTLKGFQQRTRTVDVDAQSNAVISMFANLKTRLAANEVALSSLLSYATPNHPEVEVLRAEIAELKRQLTKVETGGSGRSDLLLPSDTVPGVGVQYARLLRNVKYQEALWELLIQQYEMARIQEAKDTPTVQILDVGQVPQKKCKPRRTVIVLVLTAAALILGILIAFVLEYAEAHRLRGDTHA
ncbi:MAG: Wzz/FepE/Etk N-terminal domain-containing protein [Pseudomonadota bacterium]